jgi:D-galactonate transporter
MSTSVAAAGREKAIYAKVSLRLVPFLFLCYVAAYLDRVNVGFAKLQMLADLKFSETIYGLGAGIFFIGYFLFEVPSNVILHRVGARLWIARIMITWGLISSAMMFVSSPMQFYVLRFLLGVSEAGFFPGIILYLTYWYPAARRGHITALFMTAVAIAGVIGGPLSGWILQSFSGAGGLAGWQWLFVLEGLPSVLIGIWVIFYLDDSIVKSAWLSDSEKKLLADNIAKDNQGKRSQAVWDGLRDPKIWLMSMVYFCFVAGLYGIGFWLPTIIKAMGVKSALDIGLLSAIPYMAAAVCMVLVGRSADHFGERRWHVIVPALLGAVGLVLSVKLASDTTLAMFALTLGTCGIITTLPLFWSLPTAILGGGAAAAGIAFINSFGNLAGFVSPYAIGWIKDATQSTDNGMYLLAVVLVLGALLVGVGVSARVVNEPSLIAS